MRIALFVEGSPPVGSRDHCARLWNERLLPALGRAPVDFIIPIGKDAISRMRGLPTSSSTPGLDTRIRDAQERHGLDPRLDALVIAWDLEPIDEGQRRCALDEKIGVYQGIADSPVLQLSAAPWVHFAARRAEQMRARRDLPPTAENISTIVPGSVLGLCMEPMFEGLLARDGRAVRRALGLPSDPPQWPTGWSVGERDPSKKLLGPAIRALRQVRPKPEVRRIIRETWENAKDEWGEYLLRQLLADHEQAEHIRRHPIARRLTHILPRKA